VNTKKPTVWIWSIVSLTLTPVFGTILSLAENRKTILDVALIRVTTWGILAACAQR
jgi:hypothetical protein